MSVLCCVVLGGVRGRCEPRLCNGLCSVYSVVVVVAVVFVVVPAIVQGNIDESEILKQYIKTTGYRTSYLLGRGITKHNLMSYSDARISCLRLSGEETALGYQIPRCPHLISEPIAILIALARDYQVVAPCDEMMYMVCACVRWSVTKTTQK